MSADHDCGDAVSYVCKSEQSSLPQIFNLPSEILNLIVVGLQSHCLISAFQFITNVIGVTVVCAIAVLTRNRPSGATS